MLLNHPMYYSNSNQAYLDRIGGSEPCFLQIRNNTHNTNHITSHHIKPLHKGRERVAYFRDHYVRDVSHRISTYSIRKCSHFSQNWH